MAETWEQGGEETRTSKRPTMKRAGAGEDRMNNRQKERERVVQCLEKEPVNSTSEEGNKAQATETETETRHRQRGRREREKFSEVAARDGRDKAADHARARRPRWSPAGQRSRRCHPSTPSRGCCRRGIWPVTLSRSNLISRSSPAWTLQDRPA